MRRYAVLLYGVANYLLFLVVCIYFVGFLLNLGVPRAIDSPREGSLGGAFLINVLLIGLFAVQHSVMARPSFKAYWTRLVPHAMERSTYVLSTNLVLLFLFMQWRPMGGIVWSIEHPAGRAVMYALFALGWLIVLGSSYLINHFDLFGLRQVWLYFRGRPYVPLRFATPGPYKHVRHPLYVGWTIAFWATPTMTVAHLLFALAMTAYMLIAIRLEERNLVEFHGEEYANYKRRTPMMIPALLPRSSQSTAPRPTAPQRTTVPQLTASQLTLSQGSLPQDSGPRSDRREVAP